MNLVKPCGRFLGGCLAPRYGCFGCEDLARGVTDGCICGASLWGKWPLVTKIGLSATERGAGDFTSATLEKASQCMRADGTLILEDIVKPALIREARETFVQRYSRYLDGREHDDALQVGNKRLMITVDLEPPFERRELIANPWLCTVLSAAFQGEFVLAAYGVVCSMPGACALAWVSSWRNARFNG